MTPRRVNRAAVHARLPRIEPWIIEALLDAFEPTALAAASADDQKRRASKAPEHEGAAK